MDGSWNILYLTSQVDHNDFNRFFYVMCLDLLISSGNLGIVTAAKRLLHQNMFFSHRASPTTEGKSSFSQTNISKLPHFLLGILSWVESIGFPHLPWVFVRILRILPLSEDLLLLFYYF